MRFAPRLLERLRETSQQASLDQASRAANVAGAFRARQGFGPGGVVLVDDVVTTGSTVLACMGALESANIEILGVVAIAQAGGPAVPERVTRSEVT
jgi:predicted amidophosphoribosyltransferase